MASTVSSCILFFWAGSGLDPHVFFCFRWFSPCWDTSSGPAPLANYHIALFFLWVLCLSYHPATVAVALLLLVMIMMMLMMNTIMMTIMITMTIIMMLIMMLLVLLLLLLLLLLTFCRDDIFPSDMQSCSWLSFHQIWFQHQLPDRKGLPLAWIQRAKLCMINAYYLCVRKRKASQ